MILHISVSSFCQGKFVFDFIGIQQRAFMGILTFSLFFLSFFCGGGGGGGALSGSLLSRSSLSEYDYKTNQHGLISRVVKKFIETTAMVERL